MIQFDQIIEKLRTRVPLSDDDYQLLYNYLQTDEHERTFKKELENHWDEVSSRDDLVLNEPDELYYKIFYKAQELERKTKKVSTRSIGQWVQRIAAILLIPLMVVAALHYFNQEAPSMAQSSIKVESPQNSRTRFFLPDGSSGWLQAGSVLEYLQADGLRAVDLKGEAFFEVAKDESHPFVVSTHSFKVKVLGTRFNVEAFEAEDVSRVFLEEGSVEMLGNNNEYQTLLKPGQEYTYNNTGNTFVVMEAKAEEQISWTKGILVLKNKSLLDAAMELEKFYNVDIEIADKELEALPVYAKIENERLEEVLEITRLILPIKYKIEHPKRLKDGSFSKRKVVISSNQ
ncbi:FecR domain-containing protein [Carboxylicivirga sediminis]|uniref:FecR domain-containing protein n=1 Tax=Carboxylicivirga sediminis TaxID=2006564 RepID=A0A941F7L7_9BACT|nr:FecR domain-containing protein [Carboxylicivirga sediminis]MBR8538311.1 FecR domain-containing protein [Carboxylicivirga sediminis]